MFVDLLFPARGDAIPTDHAYPLYAALSRVVPAFHEREPGIRFAPLTGVTGGPGRLRLTEWSHLRVRLPADAIPKVLPLAGRGLDVAGATVRLGPPSVLSLRSAATLQARIVTLKNCREPDQFLATAAAKLSELEVAGNLAIPVNQAGPRAGEPRRRVMRLKGRAIVGYAVVVSGLSADESIRLQEHGLGGRTRLGCGFFLPVKEEM